MRDQSPTAAEMMKAARSGNRAELIYWSGKLIEEIDRTIDDAKRDRWRYYQGSLDPVQLGSLSSSCENALAGLTVEELTVRHCALLLLAEYFDGLPRFEAPSARASGFV